LVSDPENSLLALARFFFDRDNTEEDHLWAHEQAERVKPPHPKFGTLHPAQQAALEDAVAPAMKLLGY